MAAGGLDADDGSDIEEGHVELEMTRGIDADYLSEADRMGSRMEEQLADVEELTSSLESLTLALRGAETSEEEGRISAETGKVISKGTSAINVAKETLDALKGRLEALRAEGHAVEASVLEPRFGALRTRFVKVVQRHQAAKSAHKEASLSQAVSHAKLMPGFDRMSEEELHGALERDPDLISKTMRRGMVDDRARAMLDEAHSRAREIDSIVASIAEITELTKDLAALIDEQGVLVDRIAENIGSAKVNVQKGNKHIEGAIKYQKKNRRTMCCLMVIAVVVLLAVSGVLGGVLGGENNA